jgi:hypothetical protein
VILFRKGGVEMPAYLKSILETCDRCGRSATEALYNGRNAQVGAYCPAHARKALKEYQDKYENDQD